MRSSMRLAWTAALVFGCSTGSPPGQEGAGALATERQRWEAADVQDYRFDFQQQCFCVREQVQPVTIEVRAGRIARVISRNTGAEIAVGGGLRWYTVSDLFRVIAEAQQSGVTPLVVRYDPQLGYPIHIEAGSLAADAGVTYTASNLQPLTR